MTKSMNVLSIVALLTWNYGVIAKAKSEHSCEVNFLVTLSPKEAVLNKGKTTPYVSIKNPANDLSRLVDPNSVVIQNQNIILVIDYPLKSHSKSKSGFTRRELVTVISKTYHDIYKEEKETSQIKVIPLKQRKVLNRNRTNGKYGIWGHDIGDLALGGAVVKLKKGVLYVYLHVDS